MFSQVEVSLLPHGTVSVRGTTDILLVNFQKFPREMALVLISHCSQMYVAFCKEFVTRVKVLE